MNRRRGVKKKEKGKRERAGEMREDREKEMKTL